MGWSRTLLTRVGEDGAERMRVRFEQPGGTRWAELTYRFRRRVDKTEHAAMVDATLAAEACRLEALWSYAPRLRQGPPAPDPDPLNPVRARLEGWGLVPTQGVLRVRVAVNTPEALCRAWWELVHPASAAEDWLAWLAGVRARVADLRRLWGTRGWPDHAGEAGLRVLSLVPAARQEVA